MALEITSPNIITEREKTIVLKGRGHHEEGIFNPYSATEIFPGMAAVLTGVPQQSGYPPDFDVAAGNTRLKDGLYIVKEDGLGGKNSSQAGVQGKTVEDAYVANDVLFLYQPVRGDHLMCRVKTGEDLTFGDKLAVNNEGLFIEGSTEAAFDVEVIDEAVPAGLSSADTLVKCRVL